VAGWPNYNTEWMIYVFYIGLAALALLGGAFFVVMVYGFLTVFKGLAS
jgi:hypothetical protein